MTKIKCTKCGKKKGFSGQRLERNIKKFGSQEKLEASYVCRNCNAKEKTTEKQKTATKEITKKTAAEETATKETTKEEAGTKETTTKETATKETETKKQ